MIHTSYHHGDLRNALIETGIELINKEGPEQLSLRKVAAACGVSQAAPYSHFKNKNELLSAMQMHVTELFMQDLNKAIASCPNANDPYVLIQIGKAYILFFINNPQYFTFLFSNPIMEINLAIDIDSENSFLPFALFKTTAIRIFKNEMTKEKLEDTIISMWATVHGLTSIATMKNVHYDKSWESKIEDIIWNR